MNLIKSNEQILRIQRSLTQPFYLLEYSFDGDICSFNISGSTTNVYKVVLTDSNIQCDCPDMERCLGMNCICKHCWFVLLRVLKVYQFSVPRNLFNRVARISTDYANTLVFSKFDRDYIEHCYMNLDSHIDQALCNNELKQKYYRFKEQGLNNIFEDKSKEMDDNCPICMNSFDEPQNLINCPTCKKYVHKKCMDSWLKIRKNCPMCRSDVFLNYGKTKYINLRI